MLIGLVFSQHIYGVQKKESKTIQQMTQLIEVRDSLFYIEGHGGNIGVLTGKDGILLIDDQFAYLHDEILERLAEVSKGEVKYVINTHWHVDHTNGNEKREIGMKKIVVAAYA